ncbi:MAG TPA: hypothetical protein VF585_09595 [Chthoniobacterales bacterium]
MQLNETGAVFKQAGGYTVGRNAMWAINAPWPSGTIEVRDGN